MTVAENCLSCGKPLAQPSTGRPRSWCSATCRQRGSRAARARLATILGATSGGPDIEATMEAALARLSDDDLGLAEDGDRAVLETIAEAWVVVEKMRRLADQAGRRRVLGEALAAACAGFLR